MAKNNAINLDVTPGGGFTYTFPSASDTLVGRDTTDTLTHKTLTASTNVFGGVTMTLGSDGTGDTYYRSSGGLLTRLGVGSNGQVLTLASGLPAWVSPSLPAGAGLSTSVSYDPPSLLNGETDTTTVTLTGAAVGDPLILSFSVALPAGMYFAEPQVTAADTVKVTLVNDSGSTQDIASGTLKVQTLAAVVPLSQGGTGSSLSDPAANKLWGWDDTDNTIGFWTLGTGLSYDHATHTLSSSGGTGTPGGSDTYVQFNDASAFGGDSQFTFNKTSGLTTITAGGTTGAAVLKILPSGGISSTVINDNGTMVIDADIGNGSIPLLLKYNGSAIWTFNYSKSIVGATGSLIQSDAYQSLGGTTGLKENATAVWEVNNGTAGQWGQIKVGVRDSGTNTITNGLTVGHQTSGTPANGLGSAILFNIDDSTTPDTNAAQIGAIWTTVTHASRASAVVVNAITGAGSLTECARFSLANGIAHFLGVGTHDVSFLNRQDAGRPDHLEVVTGDQNGYAKVSAKHFMCSGQDSGQVQWSDNFPFNGSADTGLGKDIASFVVPTNGSTGAGGFTFNERSANPANPTQDTQVHFYMKADKFVIQFNNGGTTRYFTLDLTQSGATPVWAQSTTGP